MSSRRVENSKKKSLCEFPNIHSHERFTTMMTDDEYWKLIEARICAKCVDGDGRGGCRIEKGTVCQLKRFFPQILEVVDSVYGHSMEPYEKHLRNKICGICTHQSSDGVCSVRNEVECALDRYFPLVVEVIEEAQLRERLREKH
jgi:hypothetical protein